MDRLLLILRYFRGFHYFSLGCSFRSNYRTQTSGFVPFAAVDWLEKATAKEISQSFLAIMSADLFRFSFQNLIDSQLWLLLFGQATNGLNQ